MRSGGNVIAPKGRVKAKASATTKTKGGKNVGNPVSKKEREGQGNTRLWEMPAVCRTAVSRHTTPFGLACKRSSLLTGFDFRLAFALVLTLILKESYVRPH